MKRSVYRSIFEYQKFPPRSYSLWRILRKSDFGGSSGVRLIIPPFLLVKELISWTCDSHAFKIVPCSVVTCWLTRSAVPCCFLLDGSLNRFEDLCLNCLSKCWILRLSLLATHTLKRFLKSARVLFLAS